MKTIILLALDAALIGGVLSIPHPAHARTTWNALSINGLHLNGRRLHNGLVADDATEADRGSLTDLSQ